MKTRIAASMCAIAIISVLKSHGAFGEQTLDPETTSSNEDSVAVNIAILHMAPRLGHKKVNIDTLNSMVEKAFLLGSNLIVAPELSTTGYCITEKQVRDSLGLKSPFLELGIVKDLAVKYNGYVVIGLAEIGDDNKLYNSAVVFKPDGSLFVQRKRGLAGWNARGNLPFDVISTPFGEVGIAICSDTWLMDWPRILALKGADIIATPANWWGQGQIDTWKTRAIENDVIFVVANRWGKETDTRYQTPYEYDMNDAPSSIIVPFVDSSSSKSKIPFVYRSKDAAKMGNIILHKTLKIPRNRIMLDHSPWLDQSRQPVAYQDIANLYYRPDKENIPAPGLPIAGNIRLGVFSYEPAVQTTDNLSKIFSEWNKSSKDADVLLLPSFGMSADAMSESDLGTGGVWKELNTFVTQNNIQLLVTSINEKTELDVTEVIVVMLPNKKPLIIRPIHASRDGSVPSNPKFIDIDSARIGVLPYFDLLVPESILSLAKQGADVVIVPFVSSQQPDTTRGLFDHYPYDVFKAASNVVVHVAGSSSNGFGIVLKNGGGYIESTHLNNESKGKSFQIVKLNSALVRQKFLNAYYDFDLKTLLETDGHVKVNQTGNTNKKYFRRMTKRAKNEPFTVPSMVTLIRQSLPPGAMVRQ